MKIYVAGPVADAATVQAVQAHVLAAGHTLTMDWSADLSFVEHFESRLDRSAHMAGEMLEAVMAAHAVLVVASEQDGRGMFVELGVALARASRGELQHVVLIGDIHHESVFYFHPTVTRVDTVADWLALIA